MEVDPIDRVDRAETSMNSSKIDGRRRPIHRATPRRLTLV
jgi:hypothetical protein